MRHVRGVVQHYDWGDPTALAELTGVEPDGTPWAEIWFGTHSAGPATVVERGQRDRPLAEVAGALPYMLKLLAAREPLSLQTHPTAQQAEAGFAREQSQGVPVGSAHRIYKDPFAKPELLCALTPFDVLCGFRPLEEIHDLFAALGPAAAELTGHFAGGDTAAGLRWLFEDCATIEPVVDACRRSDDAACRWVTRLADRHPDDHAALAPLLLNHLVLQPGEAVYLGPGNLHTYLQGTGVEVLGASDNVVRGGLTTKHVDVHELLEIVDTTPLTDPIVRPSAVTTDLWRYGTDKAAPFIVYAQHVRGESVVHARGRELVLCALGRTDLLGPGQVCFLAPGEELTLVGTATLFRVSGT